MSSALYEIEALRFWSEDEIELREAFQKRIADVIRRTLLNLNPAFKVARVEGPILTPKELMPTYDDSDVFIVNWHKENKEWAL